MIKEIISQALTFDRKVKSVWVVGLFLVVKFLLALLDLGPRFSGGVRGLH
jgi:hypothetical protein